MLSCTNESHDPKSCNSNFHAILRNDTARSNIGGFQLCSIINFVFFFYFMIILCFHIYSSCSLHNENWKQNMFILEGNDFEIIALLHVPKCASHFVKIE